MIEQFKVPTFPVMAERLTSSEASLFTAAKQKGIKSKQKIVHHGGMGTLLLHIWRPSVQIFSQRLASLIEVLHYLPQSLLANAWTIPQITP
jgi:hypothetical protein